jgi:hypothetical protein
MSTRNNFVEFIVNTTVFLGLCVFAVFSFWLTLQHPITYKVQAQSGQNPPNSLFSTNILCKGDSTEKIVKTWLAQFAFEDLMYPNLRQDQKIYFDTSENKESLFTKMLNDNVVTLIGFEAHLETSNEARCTVYAKVTFVGKHGESSSTLTEVQYRIFRTEGNKVMVQSQTNRSDLKWYFPVPPGLLWR